MKVLELEKEISSDKDILTGEINSLSNIANTEETDAAIHDSILQKVTSLNNRMQTFPSQIKQIADEKYYLAAIIDGKEKDITPNLNSKSINIVINSDLLMLFDSNGNFLKVELLNKKIKLQLVYIPTLESIEHKLHNASIEKVPPQILINVGINNMDKQSTTEDTSLYVML